MIIDATNLILGRLASYAAKEALKGNTVDIINAENTVITGKKENIFAHYKQRRDRGHPYAGPFFQRREDRFLKRTIRGMLPRKQAKGRDAGKRIMCYIGTPKHLEGKKTEAPTHLNIQNTQNIKYVTTKAVCAYLGKK